MGGKREEPFHPSRWVAYARVWRRADGRGMAHALRYSLHLRKLERRFGRKKVKHFCWKIGFSWTQRDRKGKEELLLHRPSVLFSKEVQNHPFSALVTVSKFGMMPLGFSSDRSWETHSMWKSPVFVFLAFGSENQHWKCYFLRVRKRVPHFKMSSKFSLLSYSFTFFP